MSTKLDTSKLFNRWSQIGVQSIDSSRYKYVHMNEDYDFYRDDESDMLMEEDFVEDIGISTEPVMEAHPIRDQRHSEEFIIPFEQPVDERDEVFEIPDEALIDSF